MNTRARKTAVAPSRNIKGMGAVTRWIPMGVIAALLMTAWIPMGGPANAGGETGLIRVAAGEWALAATLSDGETGEVRGNPMFYSPNLADRKVFTSEQACKDFAHNDKAFLDDTIDFAVEQAALGLKVSVSCVPSP